MSNLYEHPRVYDAFYQSKQYDAETDFIRRLHHQHGKNGEDVLIVGCGPGNHAKHLRNFGYHVVGVDISQEMIGYAREKHNEHFLMGSASDMPVSSTFDLIVFPFTILNHLSESELTDVVEEVERMLTEDGVVVFDLAQLPPVGTRSNVEFELVTFDGEQYARLYNITRPSEETAQWQSVIFLPDGRFMFDHHVYAHHDIEYLQDLIEASGLDTTLYDGYDLEHKRTIDSLIVVVGSR